uniref:Uncharacterized protein n=1 Tax=Lactuca sativa TaxID=4236 RepID=A0A9R1X337_LACSA|nr:hypothetical protein LSAT_V11C700362010 [Lactuca sativa]
MPKEKSVRVIVEVAEGDADQEAEEGVNSTFDKSVDVRKAAETFFGELVRVCGAEMVMKNVQDIQGPALTIVLERLKSYGPILVETFQKVYN